MNDKPPGGDRLSLGEQAAQARDSGADFVAVDHHVDHAVIAQIFRTLEAFRQLLADRLLDHARPGKADQSAGFRDVDIARRRVGGGDAARRRIGVDDDVGLARGAQAKRRTARSEFLLQPGRLAAEVDPLAALPIEPTAAALAVNLADLYRQTGREITASRRFGSWCRCRRRRPRSSTRSAYR